MQGWFVWFCWRAQYNGSFHTTLLRINMLWVARPTLPLQPTPFTTTV